MLRAPMVVSRSKAIECIAPSLAKDKYDVHSTVDLLANLVFTSVFKLLSTYFGIGLLNTMTPWAILCQQFAMRAPYFYSQTVAGYMKGFNFMGCSLAEGSFESRVSSSTEKADLSSPTGHCSPCSHDVLNSTSVLDSAIEDGHAAAEYRTPDSSTVPMPETSKLPQSGWLETVFKDKSSKFGQHLDEEEDGEDSEGEDEDEISGEGDEEDDDDEGDSHEKNEEENVEDDVNEDGEAADDDEEDGEGEGEEDEDDDDDDDDPAEEEDEEDDDDDDDEEEEEEAPKPKKTKR